MAGLLAERDGARVGDDLLGGLEEGLGAGLVDLGQVDLQRVHRLAAPPAVEVPRGWRA